VVDISKLEAQDVSNHNKFVALMNLLPRARKGVFASLSRAGAFILEPIGATLMNSKTQ
jgi:hypothetical protein